MAIQPDGISCEGINLTGWLTGYERTSAPVATAPGDGVKSVASLIMMASPNSNWIPTDIAAFPCVALHSWATINYSSIKDSSGREHLATSPQTMLATWNRSFHASQNRFKDPVAQKLVNCGERFSEALPHLAKIIDLQMDPRLPWLSNSITSLIHANTYMHFPRRTTHLKPALEHILQEIFRLRCTHFWWNVWSDRVLQKYTMRPRGQLISLFLSLLSMALGGLISVLTTVQKVLIKVRYYSC